MLRNFALTIALAASVAVTAPVAAAGPLEVTSNVLVEKKSRAADGTTRVAYVAARKALPGDHLVFELAYRNNGNQPLSNIVLDNPVPSALIYHGPTPGAAAPEVSIDGRTYGQLASLTVRTAAGATRAATPEDVTHVRWRLDHPLAPNTRGQLAFQAVLR